MSCLCLNTHALSEPLGSACGSVNWTPTRRLIVQGNNGTQLDCMSPEPILPHSTNLAVKALVPRHKPEDGGKYNPPNGAGG